MATISSTGVGTNGLDVKSIISQLVTLEKRPLDTLKLQAATVNTKISAFGQIKSLVSTLQDAAGKLTSVTGWKGVATTSSDSKFVSATAVGGTLPTTFSVEVQSLAKAQATASAALLPVGGALGSGTLRLELGKWSVAPASFTPGSGQPVDITISASDKLSDVARKINGANAGVTASVLSDASGERLLLRSKSTGEEFGFRLSVMEDGDTDPQSAGNTDATGLSRLVNGATVTQAAADAKATVNGIAVSSATNTFASTISGVTFKAEQVTTAPSVVYESFGQKKVALTVTSSKGCVVTKILDFFVEPCCADTSTLGVTTNIRDQICPNTATGIIQGLGFSGSPDYQYSLDCVNYQPASVFPFLYPGTYTLCIQDEKGCENQVDVIILPSDDFAVEAGDTMFIQLGETTELNAIPIPSLPTTVSWSQVHTLTFDGDDIQSQLSPAALPAHTGWYVVTITNEAGCVTSDSVLIIVDPYKPM